MGKDISVFGASSVQIQLYALAVFISFVFLLIKYKTNYITFIVILLFYNGLMEFLGKDFTNFYRIGITLLSVSAAISSKALRFNNETVWPILSFVLFSIIFFFAGIINNDSFTFILSQFSRYLVLLVFFLILDKKKNNFAFKRKMEALILALLLIQILLSITKFIIMGVTESIVGTLNFQGGATATSLPILGILFIFLFKGSPKTMKEWLFIVGLLFISFVSSKRAVWFILPCLWASYFLFFMPKSKTSLLNSILILITIPILFYLGVRLTPSLNKENHIWGQFNLQYAIEYADNYTFGKEENTEVVSGRGTAVSLIFDNILNSEGKQNYFFGVGLRYIYGISYEDFSELNLGLTHKGSATGAFQSIIATGYLGLFTTLLFIFTLILKTKNSKLVLILMALFLWEYVFYTGILIRHNALSFLFLYIIIFSEKEGIYRSVNSIHATEVLRYKQ